MVLDIDSLHPLPCHVAIIMDGNGRWSKAKGLRRILGHHQGAKTLQSIISAACEWKISYLTVFAFSSENWSRPTLEVNGLMELLKDNLQKGSQDLYNNNICLRVIGILEKIPADVQQIISQLIEKTKKNTGLQLTIALSYGARDEIITAVKKVASQIKQNTITIDQITEEYFSNCLTTVGIPNPDVLIRTSGEQRLSNFLLWQMAYTELVFVDTLWPDFSVEDFYKCLQCYAQRERRYGNVSI